MTKGLAKSTSVAWAAMQRVIAGTVVLLTCHSMMSVARLKLISNRFRIPWYFQLDFVCQNWYSDSDCVKLEEMFGGLCVFSRIVRSVMLCMVL